MQESLPSPRTFTVCHLPRQLSCDTLQLPCRTVLEVVDPQLIHTGHVTILLWVKDFLLTLKSAGYLPAFLDVQDILLHFMMCRIFSCTFQHSFLDVQYISVWTIFLHF